MNILLSNNHLMRPGGSERWTQTMYDELSKEHSVDVFSFTDNELFEATVYSNHKYYSLAIINHNTCLDYLSKQSNVGFKIFTSHGVIPKLERATPGADKYVGVSEEAAAAIGPHASVIRNPINTNLFKPRGPINKELKNILFLSTHQGRALETIKAAARGYSLEVIGKTKSVNNVYDYINDADLVIGLGRSIYEAMSCNRNAIVFDYRGGDGFITPESIIDFRKNNCSGRYSNKNFNEKQLREMFHLYLPELKNRQYILENNDVSLVAEQYLRLYPGYI